MSERKLDLVGLTEIAQMFGWSRSKVTVMRVRGQLPAPYTELACGPIYERKAVEEWAADRAAKAPAK